MKTLPIKLDGQVVNLEPERILANNVIFPGEFNPHSVKLWVIGNEFGALCAVWADCEQDALDEAWDNDLLTSFAIEESEANEETARLGNASEPANLDYAWMKPVDLASQELPLLLKLAEARGSGADNLDF